MLANVALAEKNKAGGTPLTKEQKEASTRWEKIQEERSPQAIAEYNNSMRKGYLDLVPFLAPRNLKTDTYWTYRYDPWDVLSMMLIGIALYKLNILSAQRSFRLYLGMMFFGYLVGLSVNYYEVKTILDANFSFMSFSKTNLTYDVGRVAVSMGHVGTIMVFCKSGVLTLLRRSLAAVGKMALTNYIMQSLICMIVFTGVGFGLFGKLQRYELLYVVFSIWIFQLIVSPIWLKYFYYGPMEWLWRNLSYRKLHPMRIRKTETTLSPVFAEVKA